MPHHQYPSTYCTSYHFTFIFISSQNFQLKLFSKTMDTRYGRLNRNTIHSQTRKKGINVTGSRLNIYRKQNTILQYCHHFNSFIILFSFQYESSKRSSGIDDDEVDMETADVTSDAESTQPKEQLNTNDHIKAESSTKEEEEFDCKLGD